MKNLLNSFLWWNNGAEGRSLTIHRYELDSVASMRNSLIASAELPIFCLGYLLLSVQLNIVARQGYIAF